MAAAVNVTTLRITPALPALIAELDEFKGAWRAWADLRPTASPACDVSF